MNSFKPPDSSIQSLEGILLEKCTTVKAAAAVTGYSVQYLRRLLRAGKLEGIKIGQVWLIRWASLEAYLERGQILGDRRHGTRKLESRVGKEVTT